MGRRRVWWEAAIGIMVVAALSLMVVGGILSWRRLRSDPLAAPALSAPPALVQGGELGGRRPLFDGRSAAGWAIEGAHRIAGGTLVLGGPEASAGVVERPIAEGEVVEFDFDQQGSGGAVLRVHPILIDPQPPDPDYTRPFDYDLKLADFAYRRWHHVRMIPARDGTNTEVTLEIRAHHDGVGRGGGATHSLPARGGCRFRLEFRVAPGSRLELRNVLLSSPTAEG